MLTAGGNVGVVVATDIGNSEVVAAAEQWHDAPVNLRIIPSLVVAGLLLVACGNDDAAAPVTAAPATVPATVASTVPETTPATTATTTTAPAAPLPEVVVTYSVLAEAIRPLVDGVAQLRVIIPNGQDPHDYAPSAKDVEAMSKASMIVANGLGLEESLVEVIERLEGDGVPVFRVTDHVTLMELSGQKDDGHDHGHDDDHGSDDPHVWTDPVLMAEMLPALASQLGGVLGVDLSASAAGVVADLEALDTEVGTIMQAVAKCTLVTGHDSMQYFARRYGCEVVGAVIPSLSTGAEASAGELATLREVAQNAGVAAIFTELGTPANVAAQIAREVGVPVVELSTHVVPEGGGFRDFMTGLASDIAGALS